MIGETETFLMNFSKISSLITKVLILRKSHEFSVTSWLRTIDRNDLVGGLPKSLHLSGLAVDVILDKKEEVDVFKEACNSIGVYCYDEGDHLHLYERVNN